MNNSPEDLDYFSQDLLSRIAGSESLTSCSQTGGGNNKVFILEMNGIPKYVMKHYFRHVSDPRDRCRAEWTFLEYAGNVGASSVPRPILCDPEHGIAVIEYIEGHKIPAGQVSENHITQALDFFESLNKKTGLNCQRCLSPASESCFSLRDHLDCVDRRINRLLQIEKESEIDQSAYHFIRNELVPLWESVRTNIMNQNKTGMVKIDEPLPETDICVSPSDFGFHNAIQTDAGTIFFIDFEYAGRDDPVKMICDFFCQPEVPVPHSYLPMFAARVLNPLGNPERHHHRLEQLLPIHTLKWCCIILNEFLPDGRARRLFAHEDIDIDEKKRIQLEKVKKMFRTVSTSI